MSDCLFCQIIAKEIPAHTLYEDEEFLVLLDAYPATQGQTLVIPKKHESYVFTMDDLLYSKVLLVSKKIANALDDALSPLRTCMIIEGFMVDHVHVRLHPSYEKRLITKPLDPRPTDEEFAQIAEKIRLALSA